MPKRSRIRGATLAAALLLGSSSLASCSDNPAPEPLASDTPSATATATATPSPTGAPALPPEARGTTRKSAVAFVRHWVDTLNYSADTLDTKHLRELSAPGCTACEVFAARIEGLAQAGGSIRGQHWRPATLQVLKHQPPNAPAIRTLLEMARQTVIEEAGGKPQKFSGGSALYTFHLAESGEGWVVSEIERAME